MKKLVLIICLAVVWKAYSQQSKPQSGTVIPEFGKTFIVENPDFKTNTDTVFNVVFDVYKAPQDPSQLNKTVETLARFLNMHKKAGVPVQNMNVRMALHGPAAYGVLNDEYYEAQFGVKNPNIKLFEALDKAGVAIILCGQTAHSRNITQERRLPLTQVALSAMTVLIQSQEEGYQLISF